MASFILNFTSQLVQAAVQLLGHLWTSGGFWAPNVTKPSTLMEKSNGNLAWINWVPLYRLLSFYGEYVLAFTKLVEPLCNLLGPDTQLWMLIVSDCICKVV